MRCWAFWSLTLKDILTKFLAKYTMGHFLTYFPLVRASSVYLDWFLMYGKDGEDLSLISSHFKPPYKIYTKLS